MCYIIEIIFNRYFPLELTFFSSCGGCCNCFGFTIRTIGMGDRRYYGFDDSGRGVCFNRITKECVFSVISAQVQVLRIK